MKYFCQIQRFRLRLAISLADLLDVQARFKSSEIYTMTVECKAEDKEPDPIVLMHGFGTGSAIWCNNFHELAAKHDVHAFDLLGW